MKLKKRNLRVFDRNGTRKDQGTVYAWRKLHRRMVHNTDEAGDRTAVSAAVA